MKFPRLLLGLGFAVLTVYGSLAADKDLGTGYELENVHVMDKSMRLVDARRYMLTFNEALGLQCRDCHNLRDFAQDDGYPLKLVAREMMQMQKDLNEKWFPDHEEEVITCWTCHQGELKPAVAPIPE